jgi:hypothetical protein
MTQRTRPNPLSILPQYPILPLAPAAVPNTWSQSQIIYKKLTFSITTDGLQLFHHTDSYAQTGTNLDINQFVQNIFSYNFQRNTSPPTPLNFSINGSKNPGSVPLPGYMVFELDRNANWFFRCDAAAVTTGDANNVAATPEYFNLWHMPNSGDPAQINPVDITKDYCNIAYFSFVSPSKSGALKNSDPFNLYATLRQTDGSLLDITIDPDITNTGGPPPGSDLGGSLRKHKHRA